MRETRSVPTYHYRNDDVLSGFGKVIHRSRAIARLPLFNFASLSRVYAAVICIFSIKSASPRRSDFITPVAVWTPLHFTLSVWGTNFSFLFPERERCPARVQGHNKLHPSMARKLPVVFRHLRSAVSSLSLSLHHGNTLALSSSGALIKTSIPGAIAIEALGAECAQYDARDSWFRANASPSAPRRGARSPRSAALSRMNGCRDRVDLRSIDAI